MGVEMILSAVDQMGMMDSMDPMGSRYSASTTLLWVIITLLVVLIVYQWYINTKKMEQNVPESESFDMDKMEIAMRLLNPNEKLVVEFLLGHGGEMLQKDIHYELDLTRVQAHRVVQALAQKGLVSVESHFITKKIVIADWLVH